MDVAAAAPQARRRSGRPAAAVAALVAVLAVALAVGVGVHRWTHPHLFPSYAGDVAVRPRAVADAATSFGVVFPPPAGRSETVTIDDVRARWSTNTARARATFWICHQRAGEDAIGATYAPGRECRDAAPAAAGDRFRYGIGPGHDYLFVTLAPTRPGVAHLVGVDLGYRRGGAHLFQHGTQTIGAALTVSAR